MFSTYWCVEFEGWLQTGRYAKSVFCLHPSAYYFCANEVITEKNTDTPKASPEAQNMTHGVFFLWMKGNVSISSQTHKPTKAKTDLSHFHTVDKRKEQGEKTTQLDENHSLVVYSGVMEGPAEGTGVENQKQRTAQRQNDHF